MSFLSLGIAAINTRVFPATRCCSHRGHETNKKVLSLRGGQILRQWSGRVYYFGFIGTLKEKMKGGVREKEGVITICIDAEKHERVNEIQARVNMGK